MAAPAGRGPVALIRGAAVAADKPCFACVDGDGNNTPVTPLGTQIVHVPGPDGSAVGTIRVGTLGSGPGQLSDARGAALDAAGHVLVADVGGSRAQMHGGGPDGAYGGSTGPQAPARGCLRSRGRASRAARRSTGEGGGAVAAERGAGMLSESLDGLMGRKAPRMRIALISSLLSISIASLWHTAGPWAVEENPSSVMISTVVPVLSPPISYPLRSNRFLSRNVMAPCDVALPFMILTL